MKSVMPASCKQMFRFCFSPQAAVFLYIYDYVVAMRHEFSGEFENVINLQFFQVFLVIRVHSLQLLAFLNFIFYCVHELSFKNYSI